MTDRSETHGDMSDDDVKAYKTEAVLRIAGMDDEDMRALHISRLRDNLKNMGLETTVKKLTTDVDKARAATNPVNSNRDSFERCTDLGNARRLVKRHGKNIRYVHPMKAWFVWQGHYWQRDESGEIMRLAQDTVESIWREAEAATDDAKKTELRKFALQSQARPRLEAMVALACHQAEVVLLPAAMDADPLLLGVINGVVDLTTGKLHNGRREDYITKRANVTYDAEAKCPNWEAFQKKFAGDDTDLIAYKQRMWGVSLTGQMIETLFIMHGLGANGKTTEAEMVSYLLGDYACASDASLLMSSDDKGGPKPEVVKLRGRRANFINETSEKDHLNESRVKYLTSAALISARDMYEKNVEFYPSHKSFIQTNHLPKIRGQDHGIWRRIHYIPYRVTISDDEKQENYREKVLHPEASGILNWLLEGTRAYLDGGLKPPDAVCAATKSYRKESDTVKQWAELSIRHATDDEKSSGGKKEIKLGLMDLHERYKTWVKAERGIEGASRRTFGDALREMGYESFTGTGNLTYFRNVVLLVNKPSSTNPSGGSPRNDAPPPTEDDIPF